jgi:hypothetical protein
MDGEQAEPGRRQRLERPVARDAQHEVERHRAGGGGERHGRELVDEAVHRVQDLGRVDRAADERPGPDLGRLHQRQRGVDALGGQERRDGRVPRVRGVLPGPLVQRGEQRVRDQPRPAGQAGGTEQRRQQARHPAIEAPGSGGLRGRKG